MNSVVIELQRDALNREVPVSDLLRKALVVARKLSLADFQEWINNELNGYVGKAKAPEYREVRGQVRAWNPYRGWIPVIFGDPKTGEAASQRRCVQSIAELEHLNENSEGTLQMPFSHEVQRSIARDIDFATEITLFISQASLVRIIDAVRTIILNWALKLEEEGVLGEGLTFTPEEKKAAGNSPQSINNFYGPVHGAQIQQNSPRGVQVGFGNTFDNAAVREFLDQLRERLKSLELSAEDRGEVEAEVKTAEAQLASPKPKTSILRESLGSLRTVLERAGGTVAGKFLLDGIDKLL